MRSSVICTHHEILGSSNEWRNGACSTHEKMRNTYRILDGKPERKRQLGETWA
jgi:hypothetical protein